LSAGLSVGRFFVAVGILDERFTRGEITEEKYTRRREAADRPMTAAVRRDARPLIAASVAVVVLATVSRQSQPRPLRGEVSRWWSLVRRG